MPIIIFFFILLPCTIERTKAKKHIHTPQSKDSLYPHLMSIYGWKNFAIALLFYRKIICKLQNSMDRSSLKKTGGMNEYFMPMQPL